MTKTEFESYVVNFSELNDFCAEIDCDICNSIYSEEGVKDFFWEYIIDLMRDYTWSEMMAILQSFEEGHGYYVKDENHIFRPVDGEFDAYKAAVLEYAVAHGCFDEE